MSYSPTYIRVWDKWGNKQKDGVSNKMMKGTAVDKSDALLQIWRKKRLKILFAIIKTTINKT